MKFDAEKKQSIIIYLLEKISENSKSLSKVVSDTLSISQNTVHTYLNELLEKGIIHKGKRGQYKLVSKNFRYTLRRSKGELDSDIHVYNTCLRDHVAMFPENVQDIWSYAFSEMVNNVMDHSEAETLEIAITQNFLRTQVLIVDNGIGIFEKIKSHFLLSSLDEAICELFKGKLTTDESNHSGEGIFFTSKMMDAFLIVSSGKVFAASRDSNDSIIDDIDEALPGTGVAMSLSNYTHKSAREVFDSYSNVDGAFYKTRIPIKNIFDSAPVSRSQAKRVCNRLEKFQEVILDFDEVSWMGQGFAHQLFVIFNNLHPEIKLIPINMNEGVTNMYSHVINSI